MLFWFNLMTKVAGGHALSSGGNPRPPALSDNPAIIIVIINYFIIIATICYKKAQGTNVFIWRKMFIRHCVIQAALAHKILFDP